METVTKSDIREILSELAILRRDMEYMKSVIKDDDCILSDHDNMCIREAEKEYKKGKTISHKQLKKKLGLKCLR